MENLDRISLCVMEMGDFILNDDDDDEMRTDVPKVDNFLEEVVPKFDDKQFQQHFRMFPATFEYLLGKIHSVIPQTAHNPGRPMIHFEKQVFITLWYLSNLESIRSVAQRFGVTKSTAWGCLEKVSKWILDANSRYKFLGWPTQEQAMETARAFEDINGFPGVIGIIDGSHIKITAPKEHPNSYFNRKKYHSVLLQGVCNHKKMFIDVFAGAPGSCHDSKLLELSDLPGRIRGNPNMFPNNTHLIGDLAYKLENHLMVGFKNFGNLTPQQKNLNEKLSAIRVYVEHSFAYLKGRLRRLKFLETVRMDFIVLFIVTGCILHNICMLNGDILEEIDLEEELAQDRIHEVQPLEEEVMVHSAVIKRNEIMNNLPININ